MPYSFPRDVEEFFETEFASYSLTYAQFARILYDGSESLFGCGKPATLASGKYHSEDELLCEAVRALRDRKTQVEKLRNQLQPAADRLSRGEGIQLSSEGELRAFFDDIKSRGRSNVRTTMIYTHVLNQGDKGGRSPADLL